MRRPAFPRNCACGVRIRAEEDVYGTDLEGMRICRWCWAQIEAERLRIERLEGLGMPGLSVGQRLHCLVPDGLCEAWEVVELFWGEDPCLVATNAILQRRDETRLITPLTIQHWHLPEACGRGWLR